MTAPGTDRRFRLVSAVTLIVPTVAPIAMGAAVASLTPSHGGFPVAVAVIGLVLLGLAASQVVMIRRIANGASLAAIVARGLGRPAGLGAAWLSIAAYGGLQIALYGMVGPAVSQLLGRPVAWWLPTLAAWALVTATGLGRAQLPRQATEPGRQWGLILLTCLEIGVVVGIVLVAVLGRQATGPDAAGLLRPGAAVLVLPALFALAGVETSVRFAESGSARGAAGTVVATAVSATVLFALTWALTTPDGQEVLASPAYGGLVLVSVLAALAGGQATVIRHVQLQRLEWVRPGDLPRLNTPRVTIGFAAVALAAILAVAVAGGDPTTWLLRRLGIVSSYGLLVLFALAALSTVAFLGYQPGRFANVLRPLAVPAVATLALGGMLAVAAGMLDRAVGVSMPTALVLAFAVPALVAVGAGWSLVVRQRWPYRYWAIGLGANSLTGVFLPDQISAAPPGAHRTPALPAATRTALTASSLTTPGAPERVTQP
jgi:hypothetical protein